MKGGVSFGRRRLLTGGVIAVVTLGTLKLAPRAYNARRLSALRGRRIYDVDADPIDQLTRALAQARSEQKRVLAILGGNWCRWCLALDDLMTHDAEIRDFVKTHFVTVHLDSATAESLDEEWGWPSRQGVPVLVFLNADGSVAHVQETVSLEMLGGRLLEHDRGRLLAALDAHH